MLSKLRYCFFLLILFFNCSNDDGPDPITGAGIFQTTSGSATIEGELFLPDGPGPFPSMIIIPGSGNEPRQELESFASVLNQNGYALYIYDKRGVGNSTGAYLAEDLQDYEPFLEARADDILGIMELLREHDQIDNSRIGIYGSSQGAWVNSEVFDADQRLSYIVMVSGGVASVGLEQYYCQLTDDPNLSIDEAIAELANYSGPIGYDPLPIINRMDLPVLWIYGNEDRSHPARYDLAVLQEQNRSNFTIQLYTNTDHELIDLSSGQAPAALFSNLGQWLTENNN